MARKRGKRLSDLLADIEEIDKRTRRLDKQRADRVKRILTLLEKNNKKSVVIRYKGQPTRITRVASTTPMWNQAALKSYLQDHAPEAVRRIFRRQEVFYRAGIDDLLTDDLLTSDQLEKIQEFCTIRENAAWPKVTRVRDD